MSSESIVSPTSLPRDAESCPSCGAPLAGDQRYCLECGERRAPISSMLLGGPPQATSPRPDGASTGPGLTPPAPPQGPGQSPAGAAPHGNAVTVIAGVGVLLLAMGVGVLIGRSGGGSKQAAASAPQVISVATAPTTGGSAGAPESFADDWPSATNGYTVQLQTLPQSSTQASAVEAAKAAATAKGAKGVGALKSDDFSSLKAGSYIIYSGVYKKKPEAEKARAGLKKNFVHASVIKVSSAGATSAGSGAGAGTGAGSGASGGGTGASPPAGAAKALEELHKSKGKSYEEKSKNLPDVVGT